MEVLKTIVITGANKGIGYGVAQHLVSKPYQIVMACRNLELANQSRQTLIDQFKVPEHKIHTIELDINNSQSIDKFVVEFEQKFKKADILMNNAGMAIKGDDFNEKVVADAFKTNFYGTIELTEKFLHLVQDNGKIIIIGSSAGHLKILKSDKLKQQFSDDKLTKEGLLKLAQQFHDDVRDGVWEQNGWPEWGYGMSKLCINTYAKLLAQFPQVIQKKLQVYSCCPGWVRTDMGGPDAYLSLDEGVVTPLYLVELPFEVNPDLQGKFIYECKVEDI